MKLWFKLASASALVTIIAVNLTMAWLLSVNFSAMLQNERDNAALHHEDLCTVIKDAVAYERLSTDAFMITEQRIIAIAEKIFAARLREDDTAFLLNEEGSVLTMIGQETLPDGLANAVADEQTVYTLLHTAEHHSGQEVRLYCGSSVRLEGARYFLLNSSRITALYERYHHQERTVQGMSLVCTLLLSGVLLSMTKLFLHPLDRVNHTLQKIAAGNYQQRLPSHGSEELRVLSENVNRMAESVEENYRRMASLAEERKQFIDSLAHEIKTPLTSILGFAELLQMNADRHPEVVPDYAAVICEEAARLRALSGKLMELVSTANGTLERIPTRLDDLLQEVAAAFVPILKVRDVTLSTTTEPLVIAADRDLFKSLLYNLVDNAVKASPPQTAVTLACHTNGEQAIITVSDHGQGIPEEEQQRVFEPFYMTDKSRSRKAGGAGLGLALCAEIARKHDAVISLISHPHKGTTVTVTVPGQSVIDESEEGGAAHDAETS